MKNCRFCYHPVSDDCFILIRGHRSGKEFQVSDDAEFVCNECVAKMDEEDEPTNQIAIGDIVLVGE